MKNKLCIVLIALIAVLTTQLQAQQRDTCIHLQFEDVPVLPSPYMSGDNFSTQAFNVEVRDFYLDASCTNPVSGTATVSSSNIACGAGDEIHLDSANLLFDWAPNIARKITIRYGFTGGEGAESVNLKINEECYFSTSGFTPPSTPFNKFTLGGVKVSVFEDLNNHCGVIELQGEVESLLIGGTNLAVDGLSYCIQCRPLFISTIDTASSKVYGFVGDTIPDRDVLYEVRPYRNSGCSIVGFDQVTVDQFTGDPNYSCDEFKEILMQEANVDIQFPALPMGEDLSWLVLNFGEYGIEFVDLIINMLCADASSLTTISSPDPAVEVWAVDYPNPAGNGICGRFYATGPIESYEIGSDAIGQFYIDDVCAMYFDLRCSVSVNNDVSCNGEEDGSATVMASGGIGGYTYNWANGDTTATATMLDAGDHEVTVIDGSSCQTVCTVTIEEPEMLDCLTTGIPPTCLGDATGSITIEVIGGTPLYSFTINGDFTIPIDNGDGTFTFMGLLAGSYTIVVTDQNGCMTTCVENLSEGNIPPTCTITLDQNVTCIGGNDGQATVNPSGGTSPYTYLWDNGETGMTANMLVPGLNYVTVTDDNGCNAVCSVFVFQPNPLICLDISQLSPVTCFGEEDGIGRVLVNGGTGPSTYLWDNGETTATATMLDAGIHTVTITDFCGDTVSCMVEIEQPDTLTCEVMLLSMEICGADGQAKVTPSGGNGGYTYLWDNAETEMTAIGLLAGPHSVTVTDAKGCTAICDIIIPEGPTPPTCDVTLDQNVTCIGGNDGQATANPMDGTAPYTYLWDNGETTATAEMLDAGTHTVTVTDDNDCTTTCDVFVLQPNPLVCLGINQLSPVTCFGEDDGRAIVLFNGGRGPYTYLWDNGETTATAEMLDAGTHTVTITDICGDTISCMVEIEQPALLTCSVSIISEVSCFDAEDGEATISPIGGNGGYTYLWDNGETTATAIMLNAGTHTVTVTDSKGCTTTCEGVIGSPAVLECTTISTDNPECFGASDGQITVGVSGGTLPFNFLRNGMATTPTNNGDGTYTITSLSSGTYTIEVIDANGCTTECPGATLTDPPPLNSCHAMIEPAICEGDTLLLMEFSTEAVEWEWRSDNPLTTIVDADMANAKAVGAMTGEIFTVIITDANGCRDTCSAGPAFVTPLPEVSIEGDTEICVGDTLHLMETGGEATSWLWTSNSINVSFLENGISSIRAVGVEDGDVINVTKRGANNCMNSDSVTITVNPLPVAIVDIAAVCEGVEVVMTENSGSAVDWSWTSNNPLTTIVNSNMQTAIAPNVSNGEVFTVEIEDANGCSASASGTAIINLPPEVEISIAPVCLGADLILTEIGGAAASWVWTSNDSNTTIEDSGMQTATVLNPTDGEMITVTIEDSNGCTNSATVIARVNELPSVTATADTICFGETITLRASSRGVGDTYSWRSTDSSISITDANKRTATVDDVSNGDEFIVVVTDVNHCTSADTVVAVVNDLPVCAASNNGPVCIGGVLELNEIGGAAVSWYWTTDGSGQIDNPYLKNPTVEGYESGDEFTVQIEDTNGCMSTCTTIPITYDPVSVPASNSPVCEGLALELYANVSGGLEPYTFNWSGPDGFTSAAEDPVIPSATVSNTGVYFLEVVDNLGCTTSASIAVVVNANLSFAGEIEGDEYFCGPGHDPARITEVSPPSGDLSMIEFFWMKRVGGSVEWELIEGATEAEYDPGPIYVTTDYIRCVQIAGCETIVETNFVTKEVGDEVVVEISGPNRVCLGTSANYEVTLQSGANYFWELDAGAMPPIAFGSEVSTTWNSIGLKRVKATISTASCTANNFYDIEVVTEPAICGTALTIPESGELEAIGENQLTTTEFLVSPNPFQTALDILILEEKNTEFIFQIHNAQGALVREGQFINRVRVDLPELPSGVYFLSFFEGTNYISTRKVMKR